MSAPNREAEMKESVLDVLMYLFENYYMDEEIEGRPDRESCRWNCSKQASRPAK